MDNAAKLTKRSVDSAQPTGSRYIVWDTELKGFGLRVEVSGTKSYLVRYRPKNSGAKGPKRFVTIGRHGPLTPETARDRARSVLGEVANGADPARANADLKSALTVAELGDRFLTEHVALKRKKTTQEFYRGVLKNHIIPALGKRKAVEVTRVDVSKFHSNLHEKPFMANRALAVLASMYSWASKVGLIPEDYRPTSRIELFAEAGRERFLTKEELERLGVALREGETIGLPWDVDISKAKAKHLAKEDSRRTIIDPYATAAIRLLLLTGCRLREILHLRWEHVDADRGLLFLADAKAGKRAVFLNAPALSILEGLPRNGAYVISGAFQDKPRSDLKRPWEALQRRAGLVGVRLHDLRHTHASFGAGAGLGLPIIGKLLGHTQSRTTAKYAHLDNDPLMRATNAIGLNISAALSGKLDKSDA